MSVRENPSGAQRCRFRDLEVARPSVHPSKRLSENAENKINQNLLKSQHFKLLPNFYSCYLSYNGGSSTFLGKLDQSNAYQILGANSPLYYGNSASQRPQLVELGVGSQRDAAPLWGCTSHELTK